MYRVGGHPTHPPTSNHPMEGQLRFKFFMFGALGLQLLSVQVSHDLLTRLVLLSTHPIVILAAIANARVPGLRLVAAGALLNFIAIAANGGLMPISPEALEAAGDREIADAVALGDAIPRSKSVLLPEDQMVFPGLVDRFVLEVPVVGSKVVSIGDLLLTTGLLVATGAVLVRSVAKVASADHG